MTKIVAKHKLSRTYGVNLWGNPNSSFNTRPYKPGQHGKNLKKRRLSNYGLHLVEKQKLKFHYNMREQQFKNLFKKAYRTKKNVAELFIQMLESRLEVVVYRAKLAPTIFAARQLVRHRKVLVNGKMVSLGSYMLSENDVVSLKEEMKNHRIVVDALQRADRNVPTYYEASEEGKEVKFIKLPTKEEVPYAFEVNPYLIIEYYSSRI